MGKINGAQSETSLVKDEKVSPKEAEQGGEKTPKYPLSVIFIIGNEFCERFSYYGMKTVLTLFFVQYLSYDKNTSTMIYHVFSSLCYFTPILGAIISDSYLGKFRTIFYISIIYVAGNVVLSLSAIPGYAFNSAISMVGLGLIAFGTGGIKPCVAAFGGDQFGPGQELQLGRFFSVFYMSINAGSLLSTVITPILRNDVKCFGDDCYTLAFGVPAALMLVALVLFLIGKPLYKMNPPEGNIIVKVVSCAGYALKNKSKGGPKEHWLDHAADKYDKSLIEDIKAVLHVLVLYLPLPVFWALFDQQGSRWLLQATQMDGLVGGNFRLKPDQVQVVNPLLIVCCIPLFQFVIYPIFRKLRIVKTPLQRMTVGGILAASSFVIAFFVELALEKTLPVLPEANFGQGNFLNNVPCNLGLAADGQLNFTFTEELQMYTTKRIKAGEQFPLVVTPLDGCPEWMTEQTFSYSIKNGEILTTMFYVSDRTIQMSTDSDSLNKPEKAECNIRFFYDLRDVNLTYEVNTTEFLLKSPENDYSVKLRAKDQSSENPIGATDYVLVPPETYQIFVQTNYTESKMIGEAELKSGGGYIMQVNGKQVGLHNLVSPNSLWIVIQIPQYVVLTFGEIMFSITGLEFSYSQAPASMKSVLQAGWLMTVAFGNLIVVIVAKAAYLKQSHEFIMFAGLMVLDMIIFAIMAYFYKYVEQSNPEEDKSAGESEKKQLPALGQSNEAFEDSKTTAM